MLIAPDTLVRAIRAGRCLRSQTLLPSDDVLVSRVHFPSLYAKSNNESESKYIWWIFKAIHPLLSDVSAADVHAELRRFMGLVIGNGSMSCEWYVHLYLFHFWEDCWQFPDEKIEFAERYFEGDAGGSTTTFAQKLLPRLGEADAYPDIVGPGGQHGRDLNIVEVKLEQLDDRAVGQILRYYTTAREACDRTWHGCDIRRVRPILIVSTVRLAFWQALPTHFREFLHILSYRVDRATHRVLLSDARRALDTQLRERLARVG